MSSRLDLVLKKHPKHEEGIRLLAERDPSGNLKYLEWAAAVLAYGQALAPEIADLTVLFHRFKGQAYGRRLRVERVRSDIYTYRPQDLASLRDHLLKIKRTADSKRRKREKLYRIEGAVEADVVYDGPNLIVRHIKNKQASVHYGLGTKWCIAMLRESYFEDYDTHNATFFFFERKIPLKDEFDKVALMIPRNDDEEEGSQAFTALDRSINVTALIKVHGPQIFDVLRAVFERSAQYPPSAMWQVYRGGGTEEQLEAAFDGILKGGSSPYALDDALNALCCNDAASLPLLEKILNRVPTLLRASWRRRHAHGRSRRNRTSEIDRSIKDVTRNVMAAMAIHPNVPLEVREKLIGDLRRRHVDIETIARRDRGRDGRITVSYDTFTRHGRRTGRYRRGRRRRRPETVKALLARAGVLARKAALYKKRAVKLKLKLAAKEKKAATAKRKTKTRR